MVCEQEVDTKATLQVRGNGWFRLAFFRSADEGGSLVEFALVLPMMLMLMTGMFSFGICLNNYIILTNAVNAGARGMALARNQTTPALAGTDPVQICDPGRQQLGALNQHERTYVCDHLFNDEHFDGHHDQLHKHVRRPDHESGRYGANAGDPSLFACDLRMEIDLAQPGGPDLGICSVSPEQDSWSRAKGTPRRKRKTYQANNKEMVQCGTSVKSPGIAIGRAGWRAQGPVLRNSIIT